LLGDFNRFVARQVDVSHPHDLHECLCHPGLSQAYQSLSHKYRGAIECIVFAGLTDGQAAEVLGIPRQTVKSRHARAVASLRKALQHA
jgi:DNA-directed RNA polymerase specialized sigma24 family protein